MRGIADMPAINLGEIAPIGPISGSMLADRMEQISPGKALMLACNDPLAIIEDLSILTSPKMHPKANNAVIWDQSTDFLLDRLESNIRASAEAQHTKEAEAAAAEAERMKTTPDGFPAYELMSVLFNGKATAERWKREDAEREATRLARKKAAGDAAWAPYEAVLDKSKRHQHRRAYLCRTNSRWHSGLASPGRTLRGERGDRDPGRPGHAQMGHALPFQQASEWRTLHHHGEGMGRVSST
ncbi:hypothetical protein [Cupriavidus sp. GA3-3]|uniref:hypothetical protein n=1 Tax=Cupriavidus sp. GA3-3 TaxID=1229514 RepID=UPI001FEFC0D7|nr:hypothetical protein [Cupriavidus sp. GA3-3]